LGDSCSGSGAIDNCPTVYNPDQTDTNDNGIGDACDCTDTLCTTGNDYTGNLICQPTDPACIPACIDNDGDTYGTGCTPGPDCDDNNPLIHPGATEACDGVDNNCNGQIDE
jgi:hypothetical protein